MITTAPQTRLSFFQLLLAKSFGLAGDGSNDIGTFQRSRSIPLRRILVLSDGRPGHENQSMGLAGALRLRTGAMVEQIHLDPRTSLRSRVRLACRESGEPPQLIISAGHRTHLPLVAAARQFSARSVILMKPSIPVSCFDLCLVPSHDVKPGTIPAPNIIPTLGPPNLLQESSVARTGEGIILIGGPSKHHHWDGDQLRKSVESIICKDDFPWTIADSFRTPPGFLDQLALPDNRVKIVRHQDTTSGWLPRQLAAASRVWVTEDSISMVFEAITACPRVGLLPMPWKNPQSRLRRSITTVVEEGYAARFDEWTGGDPPSRESGLHEATRCADLVLSRFFSRS